MQGIAMMLKLSRNSARLFVGDKSDRRESGLAVVDRNGETGANPELGCFTEEATLLARGIRAGRVFVPSERQHVLARFNDDGIDLLIASSNVMIHPFRRIRGHIDRELWPRPTKPEIRELAEPEVTAKCLHRLAKRVAVRRRRQAVDECLKGGHHCRHPLLCWPG